MEQCQTQSIVIWFIPTIFTVIHDRNAIFACIVSQVGPVLSINLISGQRIITSLNTTDAKIVSRFFVIKIQRKFCFQKSVGRLPVDFVIKVYTISQFSFVKTNILAKY